MMKIFKISLLIIAALVVSSCQKDTPLPDPQPKSTNGPTPYEIQIPFHFPTKLNIPDNNPMTVEGIELGRLLFYDGRLRGSLDTLMTCASCHRQQNSFENGFGYAHGVTGIKTPHVMLPMINLVFNNEGYLWNGLIREENPATTKRRLEDLVWMGVYAPHEMKSDSFRTKAMLKSIPMYLPLFKKAFGSEEIVFENAAKAIAQFVRTLISANSKFDKYMRGEVMLTDAERRGLVLFITEEGADCFHCHGGDGNLLFTTNLFYNNALDTAFNDPRDRYSITGDPFDHGAYKATTLRNIELTGPYMHDGRFATLMEVIDQYSTGLKKSPYVHPLMHKINDGGAQLTPAEKQDLLAFLKTLTDNDFITNPDFSNPRPGDPYFLN